MSGTTTAERQPPALNITNSAQHKVRETGWPGTHVGAHLRDRPV